MPTCEMCGRFAELFTAEIEGVELKVCPACSKHGTIKKRGNYAPAVHHARPLQKETPEFSVVPQYGSLLRAARDARSMTQEDFAKLLLEPETQVAKWEQGSLKPSIDTAKKIGRVLNINLIEKEEAGDATIVKQKKSDEFTLGDFVKIRKRGKS